MNTMIDSTTITATTTTDAAAGPARKRGRVAVKLAGLGLALCAAAPIVAGPMAGTASAETRPSSALQSNAYLGPSLAGAFRTGDGINLDKQAFEKTSVTDEDYAAPNHIGPNAGQNAETGFAYHSGWPGDPEVSFRYTINDGAYVVWGHIKVPSAGKNVFDVQIRKNGVDHEDSNSPYYVIGRWMSSDANDPRPEIDVYQKDTVVVTDRAQQAQLINTYGPNGGGQLAYVPKTFVTDQTKPFTNVTDVFYNSTEHESPFKFEKSLELKTTDSIGVKVSGEAELFELVKVKVEASYKHEVEVTRTTKESHEIQVPPHHHAVYRYAQGYDEVKGDIVLYGNGHKYELKDVDFQFPTAYGVLEGVDLDAH